MFILWIILVITMWWIMIDYLKYMFPKNVKYIPVFLSGTSLLTLFVMFIAKRYFNIALYDFKEPLLYLVIIAISSIVLLCIHVFYFYVALPAQLAKLPFDERQRAVLREFWIQPFNVIKIPDADIGKAKSLIEDMWMKIIDTEEVDGTRLYCIVPTPLTRKVLKLKHVDFDALELSPHDKNLTLFAHYIIKNLNHIQQQHLSNSRLLSIRDASPKVKQHLILVS